MTRWLRKYVVPVLVALSVCGGLLGAGWAVADHYGLSRYTVRTGSMLPLYPVGTSVVISTKDRSPERDDIITFRNPQNGQITTHIFGGYNADGTLKTRGMANAAPDKFSPAPTRDDIVGTVVFSTPLTVAAYWTHQQGIGLILIALAIVALMFMYRAVGRNEQAKDTSVSPAAEPAPTPA
ncbi:MAG TPA: S24/S26 family peptidase [Candidatus Saccharimonadales bacterium]